MLQELVFYQENGGTSGPHAQRLCLIKTYIFIDRRRSYLHTVQFAEVVSLILLQHLGPVRKFYIEASLSDIHFMNLDQWVLFVSRNGVEELTLRPSSIGYKLPSHIFECHYLTRLSIHRSSWAPPPGFGGFNHLTSLTLSSLSLSLNKESDVLNTPNLIYLEFTNFFFCVNDLKVHAPLLQTLIIDSRHKVELSSFLVFHDLKNVKVVSKQERDVTLSGNYSLQDIIPDLISSWPGVVQLQLNGYLRQNMDVLNKSLRWSSFAPDDDHSKPIYITYLLTSLSLLNVNLNIKWQISQAMWLLANSTSLKFATIATKASVPNHSAVEDNAINLELPVAVNTMGMSSLEVLEITEISGSRAEMFFLKEVLASASSLREVSIGIAKCDATVELRISKELLQFPRASTKAEVKLFGAADNPSSTIRFP
ncbi:hypothetical protein DM860_011622 [Cuscuta australis]|uniref:FBD domain-containing protein n=1 Tax=Cuscuta australis TaxID=267555 RepID=A0A328D101_9ASTE|nr:hypothetical protein DM860_011622 [Cuscuta australis]